MKNSYYNIFLFVIIIILCSLFIKNSYSISTNNKQIDFEYSNIINDSNSDVYGSTETINNNQLRTDIEEKYGIKIKYGNELKSYSVLNYTLIPLLDSNDINKYLLLLDEELKKYPDDFFKEISSYNLFLSIYLIEDLPNTDVLGYTDYKNIYNTIITIKCDSNFANTLNHEIMHFIDHYINLKDRINDVKHTWNELNPNDYSYGTNEKSYVFSETNNVNSFFLNNYAQTNHLEDRAVLFGDIMSDSVGSNCYVVGTPLYKKMEVLVSQLDYYFDCVDSSNLPYWSRFL